MPNIQLDCAPGAPRPGDLIGGVLEGTGLTAGTPDATWFGNWLWEFDVPVQEWRDRIKPIIRPRIVALYEQGSIRYGSWE